MLLERTAGKFTASSCTEGYPHWVTLKSGLHGDTIKLNHQELSDLEYVITRLKKDLMAHSSSREEI